MMQRHAVRQRRITYNSTSLLSAESDISDMTWLAGLCEVIATLCAHSFVIVGKLPVITDMITDDCLILPLQLPNFPCTGCRDHVARVCSLAEVCENLCRHMLQDWGSPTGLLL